MVSALCNSFCFWGKNEESKIEDDFAIHRSAACCCGCSDFDWPSYRWPGQKRQGGQGRRRRSEHAEDHISNQTPRGHLQREHLVRSLLRQLSECLEPRR